MLKKILFTILLLAPFSIEALCSNQELSRYKALAPHINTYYDFDENTKLFNVTVYNIKNELYIYNNNNNLPYINTNEVLNTIYIQGITPGTNLNLSVLPINGECKDFRVRTIYINLPHYNYYHNDPVCINNSNQLCSKWANTSIYTHEQFKEKVKIVNETKEEEKKPEEKKEKYTFLNFLRDYYIYMLLIIIVFGIFTIYKLDKKDRFDF